MADRTRDIDGRSAVTLLKQCGIRSAVLASTICETHQRAAARCAVRSLAGDIVMLHYAVVFLVIALIAGILGFTGVAGASAGIAKILFLVFVVLFVVSLIFGRRRGNL
jgi:uncharacterized membrane protein YtjA (UPF0391 family)